MLSVRLSSDERRKQAGPQELLRSPSRTRSRRPGALPSSLLVLVQTQARVVVKGAVWMVRGLVSFEFPTESLESFTCNSLSAELLRCKANLLGRVFALRDACLSQFTSRYIEDSSGDALCLGLFDRFIPFRGRTSFFAIPAFGTFQ